MFNWIPVNLAVNATVLLFFIFLLIIYITKQNANNIENIIYKWLLFWNFVSLVFHLFFQGFGLNLNRFQRLSDFMGMIYFASIVAFLTLFVSYMVITTNENNEKFMKFINDRIILLRVMSILLPI